MLHIRDKEIEENSDSRKQRCKKVAVSLPCTQTTSFEMHLLQRDINFAEAFPTSFERLCTTLAVRILSFFPLTFIES